MTRVSRRTFLRSVALTAPWVWSTAHADVGPARNEADRFGDAGVRVAEPTGTFRTMKIRDRWWFVAPNGTAFWMRGVFAVDFGTKTYNDRIFTKYRNAADPAAVSRYNAQLLWGAQSCRRLKRWGFNTLADYVGTYALPHRDVVSPGTPAMPRDARMPFVGLIRPSLYSLRNLNNYAPEPVKSLTGGLLKNMSRDTDYWMTRTIPDVFDPSFEAWVRGAGAWSSGHPSREWPIGISTDDIDDIYGWGPGPDVPTGATHPHLAWITLIAAPHQDRAGAIEYKDRRVHSKFALRDLLAARYSNVGALNAAWNARYSTFDSAGGWPGGSGLLDEAGRHPWIGNDPYTLRPMTAAARRDLDDFLYAYAKQYFISVTRPFRGSQPRGAAGTPLIMGPATLNGWAGLTRVPILRAAGEYLDVAQANLTDRNVGPTMQALGDLPVTTWEGLPANPDSALWRTPADWGVATQAERGARYRRMMRDRFEMRAPSGTHPVVGIKWFAWLDSYGEGRNFGLVTFLDNAYDGRECVGTAGLDEWGYRTGDEERNYGDFISHVRGAHLDLERNVRTTLREHNAERTRQ